MVVAAAMAAGGSAAARAANCPVDGQGQVSASGAAASCTVSPQNAVHRVTASNAAQVTVNGIQVSVPYSTAATAQGGGLIVFGVDPVLGGSSIVSQYGGGGLIGLLASGAGSEIDASGLSISLPGGGNTFVLAQNGGVVRLDTGSLLNMLNSGGNQGLQATGAGSAIFADGVTVRGVLGGGDFAVHSQAGAQIQMADSTIGITGSGGGETAMQADGGGTITGDNLTVTMTGGGGNDVAARANGGSIALAGGAITVAGAGGGETALLAQSAGSTITAINVPISVSGSGGDVGAKAVNGGSVALTGGSVTLPSSAGGETGVWASGAGSTLTTAGGVGIAVPASAGGAGVLADSAGTVTLGAGTSVSTGGSQSAGIQATGSGSAVTAPAGVSVTTSGAGAAGLNVSAGTINVAGLTAGTSGPAAPGGVLQNGGALTIDGGSVTTTGAGSYGFLVQGAAGSANTLTIDSATVDSAADAFRVQGATASITVDNATVTGNNGILLNAQAAGIATLDASASQLTGAITTEAGSTTAVTLQDGTTWTVSGDSIVTSLANDASLITFPAPEGGAFKSVTVSGNYAGNGGQLSLNTALNEGGALSNQFTDRLLVLGNASGDTVVQIVNAGGAGAITSFTGVPTAHDGISVIQVAGASTEGAFTLADGYVTGGTPYQYHLNAYGPGASNGPADPTQSLVGGTGGQWDYRLQTAYVDPGGPAPPVVRPPPEPPVVGPPEPEFPAPPEPGEPIEPGEPSGPGSPAPPLPSDERPEVAPQVPAYISTPRALFQAGFLDLDSLHRRLGEIRDDQILGHMPQAEAFVRGYGGLFDYTTNRDFTAYGYNFSADYGALQFGVTDIARDDADGTLRLGLAGTLGRLWMQPSAVDGISKALFNTESLAGIATWQDRAGWYVDAIVTGGLFDGQYTTPEHGPTAGMAGGSVAVSLESGIPFPLPWWQLSLEPQAQLVWQHLHFARRLDADGIDVDLGSPDQGTARLGFRLKRPFQDESGLRVTPYLKANLLESLGGSSDVMLSGVSFGTGTVGTTLQLGGGVTGTLTRHLAVYGDAAWESEVGKDGGFRGWVMNAGLRYTFGEPPPSVPTAPPAPVPAPAAVRSYLVFFDWDRAELTGRAREIVAEAARNAARVQDTRIAVNGHTDSSGSAAYNQALSLRRAQAVAAELVRDGVPQAAIAIRGFGESHPLVPTAAGVREPQNRRVEIIIQ